MRCRITQFARESVGLCPFRGLYVREFQLSHSNPVNRRWLFYNSYVKKRKLFTRKFSQTILRNHLGYTTLRLNYASYNVNVDSLTFINFQENYQLKLPKYISTYIMLFHSIKQYLISVKQLLPILFPNATVSTLSLVSI